MPESKDYSYSQAIVENNKKNFEQQEVDTLKTSVLAELNSLEGAIWKKPEWRGWDKTKLDEAKQYLDKFYNVDSKEVKFNLNAVLSYLTIVDNRINWTGPKRYSEQFKEKVFSGTILAIQIALESMETVSNKSKKYDVGKINGMLNDETKSAIKQFQLEHQLQWKDGKPWGETVHAIVIALKKMMNSEKAEKSEYEKTITDVSNIIEESVKNHPFPWVLTKNSKDSIVNYIVAWNIGTWKIALIEMQMNTLTSNNKNWKLKYLLDHASVPLSKNLQKIKELEKGKDDGIALGKYWEHMKEKNSFCWIKLESTKPYDVSSFYQFETGKKRIKNDAFQNCQLTKWLGKIWINKTIIVDKNGKEVQKSNYHVETWYSQRDLPWGWLEKWKWLKWRHVAEDWTVRDWDWYIVVAAHKDFAPQDSIVMTTLWPGKVYDTWCAYWRFDIYVDWKRSSKKKKS